MEVCTLFSFSFLTRNGGEEGRAVFRITFISPFLLLILTVGMIM